jgi:cardiolipin synthase
MTGSRISRRDAYERRSPSSGPATRFNWPNAITALRLALVAPFAWVLFTGGSPLLLLGVYVVAASTDWVDGALARRLGQVSPRGAWLDQMVDRAFTIAIVSLLLATEYLTASAPRPGPSLIILLALTCTRELIALPGVLITVFRGMPRYHVEYIGKLATFVQSVTLGAVIARVSWTLPLAIACALVGALAGANYVRYALRPTGA